MVSCKKNISQTQIVPFTITPTKIAFVYETGAAIEAGACINPNTKYAIAISATIDGVDTTGKGLTVKYTFNGKPDEITFLSTGTEIKKVSLINGNNNAQLVDNKKEANLFYTIQEFELVD